MTIVRTQGELDAALKAKARRITIDADKALRLFIGATGESAVEVAGESTIQSVGGSATIQRVGGSATYSLIHDGATEVAIARGMSTERDPAADYIAAWDPAVALAVADWLDAMASRAEAKINKGGKETSVWSHEKHALSRVTTSVMT